MADKTGTDHDEVNENLQLWLNEFSKPPRERSVFHVNYSFPSDRLRDEYLASVTNRSEREVRALMRRFLAPQGSLGHDRYLIPLLAVWPKRRGYFTEFESRLFRRLRGDRSATPWEGLTWVLDLLPSWPLEAIRVVDAYLLAHAQQLPDGRIDGLSDVASLIRSYFMGVPSSMEELLQLLLQLESRDFEHLVDEVYNSMGYTTQLTPARKDGGRDILATRDDRGHRTSLRIECKNWSRPVGVEQVRALYGVIEDEKVEKGLIVGTSGFTSRGPAAAVAFAARNPRLELVPGFRLIGMLGEQFGRYWPSRVDGLISASKRRLALRV